MKKRFLLALILCVFLCACGSGSIGKFSLNINNNCTLLEPGEPLTTPDTPPAPEGMSFAGWTWTVRGETLDSMPATMPQADVIGMPIWVPNSYTLTIDGTSSQVAYGTTLTPPASPTAKGKSFTGWTWTVGGKTVDAMPKTMPAADVTAVANWKTNSYTLTINGTSTTVAYGTTLTAPAALTAPEGKSFSWIWTVGGKKVDAMPKTMPAADVTAVANWTVNTYTLTINGTSSQVAYGTALAAPAAPTAPEGKSFGGWTWTVGGKTVSSMPKTMPAADVTAAANWKTNSYTLTINGTSKQVAYGTALTAPLALADSENSAFGGWIWTVDGKKVDAMPATMPAANVTATPNWLLKSHDFDIIPIVETYTLTINGESKQVAYGTHLLIPARPTAEGKTFIGWTWTVGGKKVATMPKTMPAANVTATANWRTNSYTLTINGESKQVVYGTTLTAPAAPTAEGKTFVGWTWTVGGKTVASMPATMPAATVTATPNWTVNSYTLTINGASSQVPYGTALTVPAAPTAEGKTFTGWTWTVGGKTVASMPATMPAANVTAAANWTTNSYTLTINGENKQVAYGATLTAPAAPTAEGKTFTGWTWTVGGKTVASMPATMPAATVTATPNWTVNSYTLTINGESKQVVYGTTLTAPANPTAPEGKTFAGWTWTVGSITVDAMPKTMPAATVTATPNWTVNSYTLTINGESKQVAYGTTLTAPANPTAPEGKTFTGWTWTVGGKTVDAMPKTMPAADVTAVANWTTNSYTLTINGASSQVPYGTALTAPANPTAPEGKTFAGWTWTVGNTTVDAMPKTMPAAAVTAVANWTTNSYTLTINGENKQVAYGATLTAPAAPTAEGKTFTGWTWTVGGKTVDTMPKTMPAADVTATANWKVNSYKLTINGKEETVLYGTALSTPTTPTAPVGHSFFYWKWTVDGVEAAKPETMPAADVTAEPIWMENNYCLTIDNVPSWIAFGSVLSTPAAPAAPEGYSFNGWTWKVGDTTVDAMPTTMPAADVTATANWKVNSYKLTINGQEETVPYGTTLGTPVDPTAPKGHSFGGWKWIVGNVEAAKPAAMPAADVTVVPIWTVNTYTLTINNVSKQIDYGTALSTPTAPAAPKGHSFSGWTWTVDGVTVSAMPTTMPDATVTATANWKVNSYKLTINGEEETVLYGTALSTPTTPTAPEGYRFDGWKWKVGDNETTMPATMPDANVSADPIWIVNTYSLTINGVSSWIAYGTPLTAPANPTAEGKTFAGWTWTVGNTTVDAMPKTMPAAAVTAVANWKVNSYNLTINGTSTQVAYGTALTAPADPTPATGYSFDHWEWSFGGITQNTMPATMPAADVTAKPIWKQIDYSMIFYDGYGKTLSDKTYHYGDTIVYPVDPTHDGMEFQGWSFSVSGNPITMPAQNVTATATWKAKSYNLTINGTSTQVAYGTALTAPADPTPATGYSFDRWEWSFGGITQNTMPATMPAADVTAKPIWKQIDYSMIFYDGYGKTLSEETYHYGDTIVYPANPTYKGKIFNGWNFSVGEKLITMPAQNVTATAAWSDEEIVPPDDAVQYTVSFQWPNDGYVEYQLNEGDPIPYNQITLPEGYKWDWTDKWIMPAHNLAISAVPIENPDVAS